MNPEYDSLKQVPPVERLSQWPKLVDGSFDYDSDFSMQYNCASWAVGETHRLIDSYSYWWPDDLEATHTAENYADLYRKYYGFEDCNDGDLEEGVEKLAIFANKSGEFKHVARQLKDGHWTSKMGDYEDISHNTLETVSGGAYGQVALFLKRVRKS
jgi:hypothetical protein